MTNLEIILNLWYVYDDLGMIYSLRVKLYVGTGTDQEKTDFLRSRAGLDWMVAQPFPIPEGSHTTFLGDGPPATLAVYPCDHLKFGDMGLFESALRTAEAQLPAQTNLKIPEDPIVCITPIFADEQNRLHPQTALARFIQPE